MYIDFTAKSEISYYISDTALQCGGILNETEGSVTAPYNMYETRYDEDIQCSWTINAAESNVVEIRFTSFELEEDELCRYDNVEVEYWHSCK